MDAGVVWSLLGMSQHDGREWNHSYSEYLGLTIRLAQSLGLHYDPPSSDPSAVQTTRSNIWCESSTRASLFPSLTNVIQVANYLARQSYFYHIR